MGGGTRNLIRKAQSVQNSAARWVTGVVGRKRTRIPTLLNQTGWFSIKEMTTLNSATILWKVINQNTPRKLFKKLQWDPQTLIFQISKPRINFSKMNFSYRACMEWNTTPDHIKTLKNLGKFKKQMKEWIRSQRPRMPD